MEICILQADSVMEQLRSRHGDYPQMIERVLIKAAAKLGENLSSQTYDVVSGDYPAALESYEGYVISGSRQSVYDGDAWISMLRRYVVRLHEEKIPLIGICFGHQLIADELGGKTEAAVAGWGVGAHQYDVIDRHWCMSPIMDRYRLLVSHKDQVTKLPREAKRLAHNVFCPNAMFSIDNHILALQGHPEFLPDYSKDLMNWRREIIGEPVYQAGIASLENDLQSLEISQWMVRFLKGDRAV